MADVKISELAAAATLTGTEEIPVVQSGVTKRATVSDIRGSGGGGGSSAWNDITDKPAVIAAGADAATARAAIGAGTSDLALGSGAGDAMPGNTSIPAAVTWSTISGKPTVVAEGADQATARAAIGAGTSNLALGTTGSTALAGDTEYGYKDIPQNSQSAAYTCVLADAGKHILHPSADTTARTFTIPANSSVAYPIGTAITFVNQTGAGVMTIAITTDTMRLAGAGTTGSRTLAANGVATALKITSTEWIISGGGLT